MTSRSWRVERCVELEMMPRYVELVKSLAEILRCVCHSAPSASEVREQRQLLGLLLKVTRERDAPETKIPEPKSVPMVERWASPFS